MAEQTGLSPPLLLELFGTWLFPQIVRAFPAFLVGIGSTFDLLTRYETHVAAELRSLHPDANPPQLTVVRRAASGMDVVYRSPVGLADLACGLLRGSIAWFDEAFDVRRADQGPSLTHAVFQLRRRSKPAHPDRASNPFAPGSKG